MIEKWRSYCGGSGLLAWITLLEAASWLVAAMLSIMGNWLHFNPGIAEWLTLPSDFRVFITRPWTLVTYMAIHFDVFHVVFNLLWLYWFGRILLINLSDRDLAGYFFGGGIAGGVAFLCAAAMGWGGGWLCGCSAAVISVMAGAAIRHPNLEIRLLLIGNVKLKWVAVICCLLTFIGGGGNQAAHIGGLLWGVGRSVFGYRFSSIQKREGGNTRQRSAEKMVKVLNEHRNDMERLDQLLDKIKSSGYESLSRKERKELNELSKRIKR